MATVGELKPHIANGQMVKMDRLESLVARIDVKRRFEEILGDKSASFISSLISATKSNPLLKMADPTSILSAGVVAATLDLPINPNLGFAAIVPYRNKEGGQVAQFQMMWRGFVQLAIRTGQYKTMNTSEVYSDEFQSWNPITGDLVLTPQEQWKERYSENGKIVGYAAYFRLVSGFEKFYYMTVDEVTKHGKMYSQTFKKGFGQWVDNFRAMAMKTVLKLLLSKYGILSVQMQRAMEVDQAIVKEDSSKELTFDHADAADAPGDAQEPMDVGEIKS